MTRSKVVAAGVALLAVVAAGVASGSRSPSSGTSAAQPAKLGSATAFPKSNKTLQMAFNFDMQVPDPDIFYQADGLNVVRGAYEGLLRYKPNTKVPTIQPLLAKSFTTSKDGRTYTFRLRPGVKFQDGTSLTAKALITSFQRRVKVNAGPAYMLSGVKNYQAPNALTFVITLKKRDSAFIHFLASPYGPVAISPKVLKEKSVGGDFAKKYLATHSAGTGPYMISKFVPGEYELTRFDGYWGNTGAYRPAYFQKVHIRIIPDFTTQMLELESGGLDIMIHGVSKTDIGRFTNSKYNIFQHFGINFVVLHLNTHHAVFEDARIRRAVPMALNRSQIVSDVWGSGARLAKHIFPQGMLPPGVGEYKVKYDPAALRNAVKAAGWKGKAVDLTYTTDDPVNQQLAGLMAAQLTAAGLKTTSRGVTQPETFDFPTKPGVRPDALVLPATPDAAHPFTWSDLFYRPGGGLSYFGPTVCSAGDRLSNEGLSKVGQSQIDRTYAAAAAAYQRCGAFVPIADVAETIVARKPIVGVEHEFDSLWAIRLASLHE